MCSAAVHTHASKSTKGRTSLYLRNPCDVIQMFGLQRAQRYITTSLAAAGTMPTPSDGTVSRYRPDPGPRTRTRGGWYRVRFRLICMEFAQLCPTVLHVIRYSMFQPSASQTSAGHHADFRVINAFSRCMQRSGARALQRAPRESVPYISEIHVTCCTCLACRELTHTIQHR